MDDEGAKGKRKKTWGRRVPIVETLYKNNLESYTSAGGFLEDDDEEQEQRERMAMAKKRKMEASIAQMETPENCIDCGKPLLDSFLWDKFCHPVCDMCRDDQGRHKLIPRTEAKKIFLLKDCDLDMRLPVLRYISKKNPHNPRYGDMKLYLKAQRVLDVHGSTEKLDEEKESRSTKKEIRTEKRFEKKIKALRQEMTTGNKMTKVQRLGMHEHSYGDEQEDEASDEYFKICSICDYKFVYHKL